MESFRYLGTVIDSKLSFDEHADALYKKANQRLFLLRKLRSFGVSPKVLELVYRCLVESILSFGLPIWFGYMKVKQKAKLARVVNTASKLVGREQRQLSTLHRKATTRMARVIVSDNMHPLHGAFEKLPSGRRYRMPFANKCCFRNSFVPSAVRILNAGHRKL